MILTKDEVIKQFKDKYGRDISEKLRFKVCDHTNNRLSPEPYCYKLYFTEFGQRKRLAYWPNTVGYQGL